MSILTLVEQGIIPDFLIRIGIRHRLRKTLDKVGAPTEVIALEQRDRWIEELKTSPVALVPEKANEQHYELPPLFFEKVLGERLKYSSGYWPDEVRTLDDSEEAMLRLTSERAELEDGQEILELGCGWGSLTLWMAEHYPNSRILAVSNSRDQKQFILKRAKMIGLENIEVRTTDMNDFNPGQTFDRIVSVEMFEHMRNYQELMSRVGSWLKPGGKLFVHIFTHDRYAYPYEDSGPDDWMARHFFTGGQMPSHDLLPEFRQELEHENSWKVNGMNYARTSRAWLDKLDNNRTEIIALFEKTYGKDQAKKWLQRWRLFFMACEELFRFRDGEEWYVSHYLFSKLN